MPNIQSIYFQWTLIKCTNLLLQLPGDSVNIKWESVKYIQNTEIKSDDSVLLELWYWDVCSSLTENRVLVSCWILKFEPSSLFSSLFFYTKIKHKNYLHTIPISCLVYMWIIANMVKICFRNLCSIFWLNLILGWF